LSFLTPPFPIKSIYNLQDKYEDPVKIICRFYEDNKFKIYAGILVEVPKLHNTKLIICSTN